MKADSDQCCQAIKGTKTMMTAPQNIWHQDVRRTIAYKEPLCKKGSFLSLSSFFEPYATPFFSKSLASRMRQRAMMSTQHVDHKN